MPFFKMSKEQKIDVIGDITVSAAYTAALLVLLPTTIDLINILISI